MPIRPLPGVKYKTPVGQYLYTLSERIGMARKRAVPLQVVKESEAALEQIVTGVLGHSDQPNRLYHARRQATETLLRLDAILGIDESAR